MMAISDVLFCLKCISLGKIKASEEGMRTEKQSITESKRRCLKSMSHLRDKESEPFITDLDNSMIALCNT